MARPRLPLRNRARLAEATFSSIHDDDRST